MVFFGVFFFFRHFHLLLSCFRFSCVYFFIQYFSASSLCHCRITSSIVVALATKLETYIFASNYSTSSSSCVHIHTVHTDAHTYSPGSGTHWIDDKCLNAISNAAWMNMNMHKSPHERVLINVDLDIHIASHHCLIVCQRLSVLSMAVALPIHPPFGIRIRKTRTKKK